MGDRRGAQDVDVVKVTICFNGKEKKIPLVVQPSPQLSDVQLELAFDSLTRLVQQIFKITDSRGFTLRDSHSYSKLNKNSFRQEHFPLKWNVVYDKCEANDAMIKHGGVVRGHALSGLVGKACQTANKLLYFKPELASYPIEAICVVHQLVHSIC